MAVVDQPQLGNGATLSPDELREGDFDAVETDISSNTRTTFAELVLDSDEAYLIGQGMETSQEYARGRVSMTLDDGSGNEPDDQTIVEVVILSSQGNVKGTLFRGRYGQLKQGGPANRADAYPLPERKPMLSDPRRIGLRAQAGGSSSYSVDLSSADTEIMISAVRAEN